MTQLELNEIVENALNDARISGCIASNFREDLAAAERHRDGEELSIRWHDRGDGRRCTIFAGEVQPYPLAQVDLGENASLRIRDVRALSRDRLAGGRIPMSQPMRARVGKCPHDVTDRLAHC